MNGPSGFFFRVEGTPAPQGSKSLGRNRRTGKAIQYESSKKVKPWRLAVSVQAKIAIKPLGGRPRNRIEDGPIRVDILFKMRKPPKTFRSRPYIPPDLDKLIRSTLDALSGILYRDDEQVCEITARKAYEDPFLLHPGAEISVTPIPFPGAELTASQKNRQKNEINRLTRRTI